MSNLEGKITQSKGVIVACDVGFDQLSGLVCDTRAVPGIVGYKIGMQTVLSRGLRGVVREIRSFSTGAPSKVVIHDYQKAFETMRSGQSGKVIMNWE